MTTTSSKLQEYFVSNDENGTDNSSDEVFITGINNVDDKSRLLAKEENMMDIDDDTIINTNITSTNNKLSSSLSLLSENTNDNKDTLPWIEKYRPNDLSQLISHQDIIKTIENLINKNQLPHLLFYGPAGTGKTSTILACAKKIFGMKKYKNMILELNASVDNGISIIRNKVKSFASSRQLFGNGLKLIILDEADNMSNESQLALRRVIEKYTANTRFCIICNYVSKIIPALQSRCMKFRFGPLPFKDIYNRLIDICELEKVKATKLGINSIIRLSKGDMRKCMNILQSSYLSSGNIVNEENVYKCAGHPLPKHIKIILGLLLNSNYENTLKHILQLQQDYGIALEDCITELHELILRSSIPQNALQYLLQQLAEIEHRLSFGTNTEIELRALISSFILAREMIQI